MGGVKKTRGCYDEDDEAGNDVEDDGDIVDNNEEQRHQGPNPLQDEVPDIPRLTPQLLIHQGHTQNNPLKNFNFQIIALPNFSFDESLLF